MLLMGVNNYSQVWTAVLIAAVLAVIAIILLGRKKK